MKHLQLASHRLLILLLLPCLLHASDDARDIDEEELVRLEDVSLSQDHYDTELGRRTIRTAGISSKLLNRIHSMDCIGIHELALDLLMTNRHNQNILIHSLRKYLSTKEAEGLTASPPKSLTPSSGLKLPSQQKVQETRADNLQRAAQRTVETRKRNPKEILSQKTKQNGKRPHSPFQFFSQVQQVNEKENQSAQSHDSRHEQKNTLSLSKQEDIDITNEDGIINPSSSVVHHFTSPAPQTKGDRSTSFPVNHQNEQSANRNGQNNLRNAVHNNQNKLRKNSHNDQNGQGNSIHNNLNAQRNVVHNKQNGQRNTVNNNQNNERNVAHNTQNNQVNIAHNNQNGQRDSVRNNQNHERNTAHKNQNHERNSFQQRNQNNQRNALNNSQNAQRDVVQDNQSNHKNVGQNNQSTQREVIQSNQNNQRSVGQNNHSTQRNAVHNNVNNQRNDGHINQNNLRNGVHNNQNTEIDADQNNQNPGNSNVSPSTHKNEKIQEPPKTQIKNNQQPKKHEEAVHGTQHAQREANNRSNHSPRDSRSEEKSDGRNRREQSARRIPNNSATSIENFLQRYPEIRRISSRFHNDSPQRVLNEHSARATKPTRPATTPKTKRPATTTRVLRLQSTTQRAPKPTTTQVRRQETPKTTHRTSQRPKSTQRTSLRPKSTFRTSLRPKPTRQTSQRPNLPRQTSQRPKSTRHTSQRPKTTLVRKQVVKEVSPIKDSPDFENTEDELSSADYSYLYYQDYYDELVPPHHRFQQLKTRKPQVQKNTKTQPKAQRGSNVQQSHRQQQQQKVRRPSNNRIHSNVRKPIKTSAAASHNDRKAQAQQKHATTNSGSSNSNQIPSSSPKTTDAPQQVKPKANNHVQPEGNAIQKGQSASSNDVSVGPFGYTEKGDFFTDESVTSFPEAIDVTYQGFVWALTMEYPGKDKRVHGGIHAILKDKVKRKKVSLKDDTIVRVTGRASPYNINRLTLHTANGKVHGPFGERQHKESVDFDESAPEGHALAYISGTIGFGVPLRSVSFHWRPLES